MYWLSIDYLLIAKSAVVSGRFSLFFLLDFFKKKRLNVNSCIFFSYSPLHFVVVNYADMLLCVL